MPRVEFELLRLAREIGLEGKHLPVFVILTDQDADIRILAPEGFDMEDLWEVATSARAIEQINTRPDRG